MFVAGGLLLAALPPLGTFAGKSALEKALTDAHGYGWAVAVAVVASALTGGAVLRASGRVFAGWGERAHPHHDLLVETSERPETLMPHDRTPAVMSVPPALLLAAGVAVGLLHAVRHGAELAAARLTDRTAYAGAVLGKAATAHPGAAPHLQAVPHLPLQALDWVLGAVTVAGALGIAALALAGLPRMRALQALERRSLPAILALRRLHSGCVNDYVAWLVAGLAAIGGALALA